MTVPKHEKRSFADEDAVELLRLFLFLRLCLPIFSTP